MTYIPRAVCVRCRRPYKPQKNGIVVHVYERNTLTAAPIIGDYCYSIDADRWICPGCGHEVIIGFAMKPFNFNYESDHREPQVPGPAIRVQLWDD